MSSSAKSNSAKLRAPKLSALVVVHNEEENLPDCLASLKFADELVVVLDKCTDNSEKIAKEFGAKTVSGSWDMEGERRNTGIEICSGEWIFELDADERASPELGEEIHTTINDSTHGYHLVPVNNHIGERLVKYGWGSSYGKPRYPGLFQKGAKIWGPQRVHPALTLTGGQGADLTTPITHYVDRNISDMVRRLDGYATARAKDLLESGKIGSAPNNMRRLFSRFIRCYVFRKGYREGGYGFLIALFAGLFPVLAYYKARYEKDALLSEIEAAKK